MNEIDRVEAVIVGYVRSSLMERASAPRQGRDAALEAVIEVQPEFAEALDGIGRWDQLLVTCWLHLAPRNTLKVHPRGDTTQPLSGVFGTRSPVRPNPIAVYTVDLLKVDGGRLHVRGIDAVDGTPVLDIKPHIGRLDD
ncbi:MAG: tRNA (N6-threonylcarbamoyladenosine(37)-N6)-methyltransferase TrmO [bacterium]|nr:tRNA (N6-threonylcarbamoyladenosine(37)-N6)-methyltransferase TrmO [bacterium]